ncbi:hypothetical protein HDU87_007698 [Geranomyces variabilis]|uniref:Uncharacterized protein n=1 Tax=Geranomyces variabilis TaxID=109894 RepID=A0AAD5TE58_9FUNG|nr:hypothetical protein HDU87_007698 [Geranomyces variabilis]
MKAVPTLCTTTQQPHKQTSHRALVATSTSSRPVSFSSISTTANSSAQRPGAAFYDEDSDYLPSPRVFLPAGRHGTSLRAAWDNAPVTAASRSATLLGESSSSPPPSSPELVSAISFDRKGKGPATRASSEQKPVPPPFDEDTPLARVRREKRKTWTRAAAAAYETELSSSLGLTATSSSAMTLPEATSSENPKPRRKKRTTAPPALTFSSSTSSTASAPIDLDGSVEILSIVPPAAPVAAGRSDNRTGNRDTAADARSQPDIIADHAWTPSPPRVRRQRQPAVRPYTEQEIIDLTSPDASGNIPVLSGIDAAIVAQSQALHEANRRHEERLAERAAQAAGYDDWFTEPASSASSTSTAFRLSAPRTSTLYDNPIWSDAAAPPSQLLTVPLPTASRQPQRLGGRAIRPSNTNQTRSSSVRCVMRNRDDDDDDVMLVDHVSAARRVMNVPQRRERTPGTAAERRTRRANIMRNASPPPLSDEEIARQLQEEEYGILQPPNAASIIAGLARNYRMGSQARPTDWVAVTDDLSGYPPEILNALVTPNGRGQAEEYMADGELSYERLLAISERIGDARPRGLAPAQVSALPSRKFTAGCMPADEAQCSVCLADYEVGETLRNNKWSKIKRLKGANDLQRARQTSRITRQLISSVKAGGGETDPAHNLYLASALQLARAHQMPKSTLENALKKAAGGGAAEEDDLHAVVYEGMCPPGVALVVEALTDNKNRTFAEIRHAFKEAGGSMTPVSYLFAKRGRIVFASPLPSSAASSSPGGDNQHPRSLADMEDDAIEAGVEDIVHADDGHDAAATGDDERTTLEVYCSVKDVLEITKRLKDAGYEMVEFGTVYASEEKIPVPPDDDGEAFGELLEMLENRDDVVKVHHNAN